MQKVYPCLWFEGQAEEAVNLYASIFKDVKIGKSQRYDEQSAQMSGMPEGSLLTLEFELFGQRFLALNGGPMFKFTEAVSFVVDCENQEEVDEYWYKLTADGGQESQCGWLKDKFGLSWQIVPKQFNEMMEDKDPVKVKRMIDAMFTMQKLDIAKLEAAFNGE